MKNTLIMTVAFMFSWAISTFSQSGGDVGTASNQQTMILTSIIGFLSLLATQLFTLWRDHLKGKRDAKERADARENLRNDTERLRAETERLRLEMTDRAERVRMETVATAVQLSRIAKANREAIEDKIAENTALTQAVGAKADAAYEVGNNFTARIEELRKELYGSKGQLTHVEDLSEDTNEKVTEMADRKKDRGSV